MITSTQNKTGSLLGRDQRPKISQLPSPKPYFRTPQKPPTQNIFGTPEFSGVKDKSYCSGMFGGFGGLLVDEHYRKKSQIKSEKETRVQLEQMAPPLGSVNYLEWLQKIGVSAGFKFKAISRPKSTIQKTNLAQKNNSRPVFMQKRRSKFQGILTPIPPQPRLTLANKTKHHSRNQGSNMPLNIFQDDPGFSQNSLLQSMMSKQKRSKDRDSNIQVQSLKQSKIRNESQIMKNDSQLIRMIDNQLPRNETQLLRNQDRTAVKTADEGLRGIDQFNRKVTVNCTKKLAISQRLAQGFADSELSSSEADDIFLDERPDLSGYFAAQNAGQINLNVQDRNGLDFQDDHYEEDRYDEDNDNQDNRQASFMESEISSDKTTPKESSSSIDWRGANNVPEQKQPVITFAATWKDSDIVRNPKYSGLTADDNSVEIGSTNKQNRFLNRLKTKVQAQVLNSINQIPQVQTSSTTPQKNTNSQNQSQQQYETSSVNAEAIARRQREAQAQLNAQVSGFMGNALVELQQKLKQNAQVTNQMKSQHTRTGVSLSTLDSSYMIAPSMYGNNMSNGDQTQKCAISDINSELSTRLGQQFKIRSVNQARRTANTVILEEL